MIREMYAGLLAPGQQTADAVALIKFEQHNGFEEGTLAYGRQYLSCAHPIALNPAYLPLSPEVFAMPRTRTRDGGALHLTLQDALPDAWGRLVIQARNGWQTLSDPHGNHMNGYQPKSAEQLMAILMK